MSQKQLHTSERPSFFFFFPSFLCCRLLCWSKQYQQPALYKSCHDRAASTLPQEPPVCLPVCLLARRSRHVTKVCCARLWEGSKTLTAVPCINLQFTARREAAEACGRLRLPPALTCPPHADYRKGNFVFHQMGFIDTSVLTLQNCWGFFLEPLYLMSAYLDARWHLFFFLIFDVVLLFLFCFLITLLPSKCTS